MVPMRIAQVSPLYESVPPALYGGTERIVSYLTEELVGLGHDVTLFASGDSRTRAQLVAPCARALRLANIEDPLAWHMLMIEEVYRRAADFDVVHFHVDFMHYSASRARGLVRVNTLHGRLDRPELGPLYDEFADEPVVSISDAQRVPLPQANWVGTVYHGLPPDQFTVGAGGAQLAFVGRVSPEKGLADAIAIADRAGLPLKIAAKVDTFDEAYFADVIRPLLARSKYAELLGELDERDKCALLGASCALLFPIAWPEPFGLAMIEAMACGTPVVAFRRGSVAEVVDNGATGFIVDDVDGAVAAIDRARKLPRTKVRARFERRFSARRMARDYVALYHQLATEDARDRSREPGLLHPGHEHARG